MENFLDKIYADYKRGINPGQRPLPGQRPERPVPQHERKLERIGPSHGVPDPVLQGELEQDGSNAMACSKCGSMNLSLDMRTNKMTCNECKNNDKPNKVNFEKQMTDLRENEMKDIENRMRLGEQFFA